MPLDANVHAQHAALHKGAIQDTRVMAVAYYNRDAAAFNAARAARKEKIVAMQEVKKQLKSTHQI